MNFNKLNWFEKIVTLFFILLFCYSWGFCDSLLKESKGLCDIYGTKTAMRVGDIVTIEFNESTVANQSGKGKLKNTYEVGTDQGKGFLEKFLGLGLSGGETTNVEVTTTQTHSLKSRLSAVVKEVLPNGDLVIEGCKSLEVNHEKQKLIIRGTIRQRDIKYDNTISSTKIANLTARVNGLPIARSVKKRRGGIIRWVWGLLF